MLCTGLTGAAAKEDSGLDGGARKHCCCRPGTSPHCLRHLSIFALHCLTGAATEDSGLNGGHSLGSAHRSPPSQHPPGRSTTAESQVQTPRGKCLSSSAELCCVFLLSAVNTGSLASCSLVASCKPRPPLNCPVPLPTLHTSSTPPAHIRRLLTSRSSNPAHSPWRPCREPLTHTAPPPLDQPHLHCLKHTRAHWR